MNEALFLGDSHTGTLRKGFQARGWRVHGGMLEIGPRLEGDALTIADGELRFAAGGAQARFEKALASAGVSSILDVDMPIISTFGFNTHRFLGAMKAWTIDPAESGKPFASRAVFERIVAAGRAAALAFFGHLKGKTVFPVHSPQRAQPAAFALSLAGDDLFASWLREMGHDVIDPRMRTTDANGRLKPEYWSNRPNDGAHANTAYVDLIIGEVERRLAERGTEARAAE